MAGTHGTHETHEAPETGDENVPRDIESQDVPPTPPPSSSSPDDNDSGISYLDKQFRDRCIEMIQPALERDIQEMVRGRVLWRRVSIVSETMGRVLQGASTVLAYAASWDEQQQGVLSFVAGTTGTVAIVATLFANFSRQQALERAQAINHVFTSARLKNIPDIVSTLEIQGSKD